MSEKLKKPFYKKWWFWVIVAFVVIGSYGALDEEEKVAEKPNQEAKAESEEQQTKSESDASNKETTKEENKKLSDSVVESNSSKIVIKNIEQVESKFGGNPVLALEITFTNKSSRPTTPWIASATTLKAIQETEATVETLNGGRLPDSYKPDLVKMGDTNVKSGAIVDAVISFEIVDPGNPVRLINFSIDNEPTTFERVVETK